jgi:hypothetical protein
MDTAASDAHYAAAIHAAAASAAAVHAADVHAAAVHVAALHAAAVHAAAVLVTADHASAVHADAVLRATGARVNCAGRCNAQLCSAISYAAASAYSHIALRRALWRADTAEGSARNH